MASSTSRPPHTTIKILDIEDDSLEQSKHAPTPAQIQTIKNNYAAVAARSAPKKQPIKKQIITKYTKEVVA